DSHWRPVFLPKFAARAKAPSSLRSAGALHMSSSRPPRPGTEFFQKRGSRRRVSNVSPNGPRKQKPVRKRIVMEIKLVQSAEEREQVYRLRYNVYVEEMGLNPTEADHRRRIITDPLDSSGRILAAFSNGAVVGTVRLNIANDSDMDEWHN